MRRLRVYNNKENKDTYLSKKKRKTKTHTASRKLYEFYNFIVMVGPIFWVILFVRDPFIFIIY
jgi:hypothetical protein